MMHLLCSLLAVQLLLSPRSSAGSGYSLVPLGEPVRELIPQVELETLARDYETCDDPMFGIWDPASAVPLNWSDGHVWIVELDIPVGKSIPFKFLLKANAGGIVWQPGPDRVFQSWETENTITICEDWENAEYKKIIEEKPVANEFEQPTVSSDMLIVADNLTLLEELITNINDKSATDSSMNSEKIPEKPMAIVAGNIGYTEEDPSLNEVSVDDGNMDTLKMLEKPLTDNIGYLEEDPVVVDKSVVDSDMDLAKISKKPIAIVAENIGYLEEDLVVNRNNTMLRKKKISQPIDESVAYNFMKIEDIFFRNSVRASTIADVEGSLITDEGEIAQVLGLAQLPTVTTEGELQDSDQESIAIDASLGTDEAKNNNLPELSQISRLP